MMPEKNGPPEARANAGGRQQKADDYNLAYSANRRNIRERLPEYLEAKGIVPNQNGMIHCLWHKDKNPSCRVNENYVYCFSCNGSGDIYKVAAALIGVSCDKENFREIAGEVERTLGIPEWKPRERPGPLKMSKSAIYRSELLKDFSMAIDTNDMERAYCCASLLFALSMLPDGEPKQKKTKPTLLERTAGYRIRDAE